MEPAQLSVLFTLCYQKTKKYSNPNRSKFLTCSPNFSNDEASSSPFQSLTCSNPSKSLNPHLSIVLSPARFVVLLFVRLFSPARQRSFSFTTQIRRPCKCHTTTAGTFPHCHSLVTSRRRLPSSGAFLSLPKWESLTNIKKLLVVFFVMEEEGVLF
ncbi:hypothetical protein QL285_003289 [Trifolium repens]|nr:hypothetical protein QL285_003289 [Trifolium repens]